MLWKLLVMILVGTHDEILVILSILIATFASFTALSLASRVRASTSWRRRAWLAAASLCLGGGIWSMHFVAMLAFSMPGMTMTYDLGLTLLSLGLALGFTGWGFALLNWKRSNPGRIIGAGLLMGTGVVTMHYVGMAAMRMDASLSYERLWLSISILIAVGAATAAVWLASLDHKLTHRLAAATAMGIAISGMHYAGMRGAIFAGTSNVDMAGGVASLSQTYLAAAITVITLGILLFALGAARLERILEAAARREARTELRLQVADVLRERNTVDALNEVAALLGRHFGVSRAGYGQFEPVEDVFDYEVCWTNGSVPPLIGRFPAAEFGVKSVEALTAGQTVVVDDLFQSKLSEEAQTQDTAREVDTRAILIVPFVREGTLRTIAYLNDRSPRRWLPDDVRFMEEMAERTRLVIERAAVEDQLRELNATLEARVEARTRELQEAEDARRQADSLYRAYFENTPDPLFVVRVDKGRYVVEQVNPAHVMAVGFKLEDIQGKPLNEVLPRELFEQVAPSYQHVVSTGEIYHYRQVFAMPEGPQHWDSTLVPLKDDTGRVIRLIGSSRNVTRQVVAEEALRQSQKMEAMGQLTGGVAHDFNNLLTPIIAVLDKLQRKGLGDEREQRLIGGALEAAERSKTLVQRLLSFARRQPLQAVPVDIGKLVSNMEDLISTTVGPQIELLVETDESTPAATADPNQLEMALLNLSVNARDAMPSGGTLRISVSAEEIHTENVLSLEPGKYIRLGVADTGSGMDEETARRAVEPFYSTKGVGQGTGLGLSMAHGLAAQLGGVLNIRSELGVGTEIDLWLPQSGLAPVQQFETAELPAPIASRSMALLVEDEDLVRASTADMLWDLGYTVKEANSAEEALKLLKSGLEPDLLVTDHMMPGPSGTQLARKLIAQGKVNKVLVISGYAEAQDVDPDLPRLTKPFRQSDLAAKLRELDEQMASVR